MAIDARPGTIQKVSLPQSLFRYLGSDRLTMNRAGAMCCSIKGGLVILVVLALAACSSGSATGPSTTSATTTASATASSSVPQELRDVRYCEVIASVQSGSTVTSYIYNTLGLNDCPPGRWNALTEDEVNKEYGSQSAKLNGPRHWVIDSLM